jgi:hypothetical protein
MLFGKQFRKTISENNFGKQFRKTISENNFGKQFRKTISENNFGKLYFSESQITETAVGRGGASLPSSCPDQLSSFNVKKTAMEGDDHDENRNARDEIRPKDGARM